MSWCAIWKRPTRSASAEGVECSDQTRAGHRYRAIRNDQAMLRRRIRELAAARVRYGYLRIYILLRREGWKINHKRVYRLYRQEGLSMRLRWPRHHVMAAHRAARPAAGAIMIKSTRNNSRLSLSLSRISVIRKPTRFMRSGCGGETVDESPHRAFQGS